MALGALIVWIITAIGGSVMLGIWLAHGGAHTQRPASRLPAPLMFGHLALAVIGLILWIIYVITDQAAWGRLAFALLVLVVLAGAVMFVRWAPTYSVGGAVGTSEPNSTATKPDVAERHFPAAIVGGHGILAVATLALVLTALD